MFTGFITVSSDTLRGIVSFILLAPPPGWHESRHVAAVLISASLINSIRFNFFAFVIEAGTKLFDIKTHFNESGFKPWGYSCVYDPFLDPFFGPGLREELFLEAAFLGADFFEAFFGTLAPFFLASESPIAIACFGLVTFFLLFPLLSLPSCISCIALSTFFPAPL